MQNIPVLILRKDKITFKANLDKFGKFNYIKFFIDFDKYKNNNFFEDIFNDIKNIFCINYDFNIIYFISSSLINQNNKILKYISNYNFFVIEDEICNFSICLSNIIKNNDFFLKIQTCSFYYKKHFNVGFLGKSNSGKSSLINLIIKQDFSNVSNNFNTTKGNSSIFIEKDEKIIEIIDSAGYLHSVKNQKEFCKSMTYIFEKSDICILLNPVDDFNNKIFNKLIFQLNKFNKSYIIALTKCDLINSEMKDNIITDLYNRYGKDAEIIDTSINNCNSLIEKILDIYNKMINFSCNKEEVSVYIKNKFNFIKSFNNYFIKNNKIFFIFKRKYIPFKKNIYIFFKRCICKYLNIISVPVVIEFIDE